MTSNQALGKLGAACLLVGVATLAFAQDESTASAPASPNSADTALVDSLQEGQRDALQQGMPGLIPIQIRELRKLFNEQEAARNNPKPPEVSNRVTMLKRGESPTITIMERFDTSIMFTDRHGDPIEITAWRINGQEAAKLVPIYGKDAASQASNSAGAADSNMVSPGGTGSEDPEGPVTALIVAPESAMRSTNITVKLKGQLRPIILTVTTRSSLNNQIDLAYLQELRLSWVSNMNRAQALAGKFIGEDGDTSLSAAMLSLVQGIPTDNMVAKKLEGALADQVSLWHDEVDDTWYLRMAEHIEPWNVSIKNRTRDGLRGFTVAELNGAPPRLLDVSANGSFSTLKVIGE